MNKNQRYFKGVVLVGIRGVAEILQVSKGYIHSLIQQEKIPVQKTSSGYIFPLDAVIDFQRERIQKAKHDPRIHISK